MERSEVDSNAILAEPNAANSGRAVSMLQALSLLPHIHQRFASPYPQVSSGICGSDSCLHSMPTAAQRPVIRCLTVCVWFI
jgi:hypothetical protein